MLRPTLLLTALAVLIAPAAASAVTIERTGNDIYVTSEAGEDNDLTLTEVGNTHIVIRDNGNVELPIGGGCFVSGPAVHCSIVGLDDIIVDVGMGDNAVKVYAPYYTIISGPSSSSNDFDAEGASGSALFGGAGNDRLIGSDGIDSISAAGGDDTATGREGADTVIGGTGNDTLAGDADADLIGGGSGIDTIEGGSGDDKIDGGTAGDTIAGNEGIDTIKAADGFVDKIDCAGDFDEITKDADDALSFCPPKPEPPAPADPSVPADPAAGGSGGGAVPAPAVLPVLRVGPAAVRLTSRRNARIKLSCSSANCTGTLRLTRKVKGKTVVLGRARYSVAAGKSRVVNVRVSKNTVRRIGRKGLKVTATAGNAKRSITIKKGRS
jgi:Ca2+-binding RTX toxin-like protein